MLRRDALKSALVFSAGAVLPAAPSRQVSQFGAMIPTREQLESNRRAISFHQRFHPLKGISQETKNVFLWRNLEKEIGEIEPHVQSDGDFSEGDCVGQASAMGCDVLAASDVHYLLQRERWEAKASVEAIYWGSRVEIGGGKITGGGSHGEWAAKYLKQYGVLHRKKYRRGRNRIDLRGYDPRRSRENRDTGVPDWLEPIAQRHPVVETSNVKSGSEALDAIVSGQPVILCSSYAFHDTRDSQGFCQPFLGGSRRFLRRRRWIRRQWWHSMILTGALLEGDRIGGLVQNSHGAWNSGPRPFGIPAGSFFVDLKYLDLMVKDWYDCWALSGYRGHAATRIRKHLLFLRS